MSEAVKKDKIPVAVLAATGTVGQRFVTLLANHPWFEVVAVTGSERRAGQRYRDAVTWVVPGEMPLGVADMILRPSDDPGEARLLFSALPTEAARDLEPELAAHGYAVCSNASALRMEPDVPLLIPEINPDHIHLLRTQRSRREWSGCAITAPNCSTTGIIFPLKILHDAFGLEAAHIVTLQAISGAGYPGVSSFDILDNVIPYIGGEEKKIETETTKLLGCVEGEVIANYDVSISAQTNRVPITDGHMGAMSLKLREKVSLEDIRHVLRSYRAPEEVSDLPGTPPYPVILREEPDRPQPRRDRDAGGGMAVTVGRVQPCPVFDVRLVSLVHNTVRGAAGGAIHNAEWMVKAGYLI